jgi:hypothetical protein
MAREFFLGRNLGNYTDTTFGEKAGLFNLNKWLKKALKLYNVPFYDECCPTASTASETLTGAGAVSLKTEITLLVTTGANALTLGAGFEGQKKFIKMKTDGGDGTLTPSSLQGGTTITFNDAGDFVNLIFVDGKWNVLTNSGTTIA